MQKILCSTVLISSMLLTSGCMTTMLWGESPVKSETSTYKTIKTDQLLSFGKAVQENSSHQKFVVIGQENLYVIDQGNEQINDIINLKFPNAKLEIMTDADHKLRLEIDKNHQKNEQISFNTNLMLVWTIDQPSVETIENLKAKAESLKGRFSNKNQQSTIQFEIPLEGHIYTNLKNNHFDQNQKFVGQYAIDIGYFEKESRVNFSNLVDNLFGTPIALAADIIIIPFAAIGLVTALPAEAIKKANHK